jgi:hypothetical protein
MDKDTLSLYVSHKKDEKVVVTKYEQQWSNPDNEYFLIIYYQIPIQNRPYMTLTHYTDYSSYLEWERIYLRGLKINRLMKRLKNDTI